MTDITAAMLEALGQKPPGTKNDWELLPRQPRSTANVNNPMKPIPERTERRTQRSYADPTGETAVGNRKRKR